MLSPHNAAIQILSAEDGLVSCLPVRQKVALIAASPATRDLAPFNDREWEVWSCNSLWNLCQDREGHFRADRWFELHPLRVQTPDEMMAMRICPVPLYTLRNESDWCRQSVKFPFARIEALWPRGYFTCTFAYQIALAIAEGFTTIGLYGMELSIGTARERLVERACLDFWVGLAAGRGVTIEIPEGSDIAWHPHLYGYEYREELEATVRYVDGQFMTRFTELEAIGAVRGVPWVDEPVEGNA